MYNKSTQPSTGGSYVSITNGYLRILHSLFLFAVQEVKLNVELYNLYKIKHMEVCSAP